MTGQELADFVNGHPGCQLLDISPIEGTAPSGYYSHIIYMRGGIQRATFREGLLIIVLDWIASYDPLANCWIWMLKPGCLSSEGYQQKYMMDTTHEPPVLVTGPTGSVMYRLRQTRWVGAMQLVEFSQKDGQFLANHNRSINNIENGIWLIPSGGGAKMLQPSEVTDSDYYRTNFVENPNI